MKWLLDTNVLSELIKPQPDERVVRWLQSNSQMDYALSVLTFGEIEKGIAMLQPGVRRVDLAHWARTEIPRQFLGRVLSIDTTVAIAWGALAARSQSNGRPLPVIDGLILATAQISNLALVTRNTADCAERGVPVYDPWHDMTYA
ncbi:MAG: type II toxin-antitoxin system VapC family toxin [Longimicrobiales bacterium]